MPVQHFTTTYFHYNNNVIVHQFAIIFTQDGNNIMPTVIHSYQECISITSRVLFCAQFVYMYLYEILIFGTLERVISLPPGPSSW